jgi:polar amino acid transport system substrate-binding protein
LSFGADHLRVCVSIAVLTLVSLFSSAGTSSAEPIRITVTEWCPYLCTETDKPGFANKIVEAAFKSQGHEVDFQTLPWLRALDLTRKGEMDGSLAPAKAEAPDFIYPGLPVGQQQMCFFTRSDHAWRYDGISSLDEIRLGFLTNLSLPGIMDYLAENTGTERVQPISDNEFMKKNFFKIDRGRIDALIDDQNVVYYYMKREGIDREAYRVAGCLDGEPIYLGLTPARPKQSARLAAIYEAGLRSIRASGELETILQRYGTSGVPSMM